MATLNPKVPVQVPVAKKPIPAPRAMATDVDQKIKADEEYKAGIRPPVAIPAPAPISRTLAVMPPSLPKLTPPIPNTPVGKVPAPGETPPGKVGPGGKIQIPGMPKGGNAPMPSVSKPLMVNPSEFGGMAKGGKVKGYAKGGSVSSASKRGDGIAQRGKTKGKIF